MQVYQPLKQRPTTHPTCPPAVPDDAGAKATVTDLLGTIGWSKDNVLDAGDIRKSALLEALCILWVDYGMGTGTFDHGFKLLRGAAPKKD